MGLDAAQLAARLRAFKADERANHIMHAVSLSLTDEDIAAVGEYLAGLGRAGLGRAGLGKEPGSP